MAGFIVNVHLTVEVPTQEPEASLGRVVGASLRCGVLEVLGFLRQSGVATSELVLDEECAHEDWNLLMSQYRLTIAVPVQIEERR